MALTVVKYRKTATGETTATPAILVKSKSQSTSNPVVKQERKDSSVDDVRKVKEHIVNRLLIFSCSYWILCTYNF